MGYDAAKMREQLRRSMGGRSADPNEFKPPKATDGQVIKYRFYILPPVSEGDTVVGGTAQQSMDNFFLTDGKHWVDKRPYPCPRVISHEELECDMCATGFKLKNEAKAGKNNSDQLQAALSKQWLPGTSRLVNIWFPPVKSNPEELRDRVMWFGANKTVFDMWYDAVMRDDAGPAGDPELAGTDEYDPLAYGVFFDENDAFLFNLVIDKDGQFNGYKQSSFIAKDSRSQLARGPIIRKADGSPDEKAIEKVLDRRHDLFSKIEPYDQAAITKLAQRLIGVSEGDDGFDKDETGAPTRGSKPAASGRAAVVEDDEPAPAKPAPAKPKPAAPKPPVEAEDDVETPADEVLSEESPLGDDEDLPAIKQPAVPKSNGKTATPPKAAQAKKPEPVAVAAETEDQPGENDPELDALLGQLGEEDND